MSTLADIDRLLAVPVVLPGIDDAGQRRHRLDLGHALAEAYGDVDQACAEIADRLGAVVGMLVAEDVAAGRAA